MLKNTLRGLLNRQKSIGTSLELKLSRISNKVELDALLTEYKTWDENNVKLLTQAFTFDQQHYVRGYKEKKSLGNTYVTEDSFESKRAKLYSDLPSKIHYIDVLLSKLESLPISILLPIEDIITDTNTKNQNQIVMKKIFISHSSLDSKIVGELIDLIESIGIKHYQIFCSSFEGYGVALGEDFIDRLKKELNEEILVFFILTQNFYNSPISLCEMGATWIKTNKHIPILIPPFDFRDVKGVFPVTNGMKINDKNKLNSLKETLESDFSLTPLKTTIWEKKRDKFLSDIILQTDTEFRKINTEIIEKQIIDKIILSTEQRISRIELRKIIGEEPQNVLQIGNLKLKTVYLNTDYYQIA